MHAPVWIEEEEVLLFHQLQLAEHGGAAGVRDPSLLASALARPQNLFVYGEDASLFDLAAAYAHGIAANHPFVDGNKRMSLVVSFTFLELNGYTVEASQQEIYFTFLRLAAGEMDAAELSRWFAAHATAISAGGL